MLSVIAFYPLFKNEYRTKLLIKYLYYFYQKETGNDFFLIKNTKQYQFSFSNKKSQY